MVAHLVEELRYKEEGCGFDFQWGNWDFFIDLIFLTTLLSWR